MTPATSVTVLASGARTVTGVGAGVDLGVSNDTCRLTLAVTAASGTSTALVVTLETSSDNVTYRAVRSWASASSTVSSALMFQPCDRYVRASWTISGSGSPSFTFSIAGEKLKPYANVAQLKRWHNPRQFDDISDEDLELALSSASDDADSRLANRYTRPISAWGDDIRKKVCAFAVWSLISERRGFNPEAGADIAVRTNYQDAERWFKGVASNDIHPQGIVDATPGDDEGGAYVVTDNLRGW